MRAHRDRRTPAARQRLWAVLALPLVVALLVSGCGGKDEPKAKEKENDAAAATEPSESKSAEEEIAPDPGYGAPVPGRCYRISAGRSLAPVTRGSRVKCSSKHTTVVARVAYTPRAVTSKTPLAKRRAIGKRLCEPAYLRVAGGTVADRATSLLTWTLFTPSRDQLERGARWVRCDVLARSGDQLVPLPDSKPLLKQGVPESLRVCQTASGADVSCSQTHAFRVEAVFAAPPGVYPDPVRYTAAARSRCKQLTGNDGGYWQPPSKPGWRSGDRFVRCLSRAAS